VILPETILPCGSGTSDQCESPAFVYGKRNVLDGAEDSLLSEETRREVFNSKQ
jgi:hypothetical protein